MLLTVKLAGLSRIDGMEKSIKNGPLKLEFDFTYQFLITWFLQLVPKYQDYPVRKILIAIMSNDKKLILKTVCFHRIYSITTASRRRCLSTSLALI